MKSNYWLASLMGFVVIIGLSACGVDLAGDITPPPGVQSTGGSQPIATINSIEYPLVPPDVANGQALYTEHCEPCHGSGGLGNGPQAANIPNQVAAIGQASIAQAASPSDWYGIITNGNISKFMPGFITSLDDRQRWDVLAYVYSLSMSSATLSEGQKVYETNCATCHGPNGKGNGPQAANLSASVPDFTAQDRLSQKSDSDLSTEIKQGLPPMPAFAGVLSESDIQAVTSYVRALTFTNVPGLELASIASSTPGTPTSNITAIATSQASAAPTDTHQPSPTTESSVPANGTPGPATTGMVHGKIIMPSDLTLPEGLEVHLTGYDSNLQVVANASTPVQPDGTYQFSNVDMPAGQVFMASVEINNVTFNSDVSSSSSPTDINLPITVYDASTDPSPLIVDRLHVFMDFSTPNIVQVIELYVISNPTDKVIVPDGGKPVLTFKIPADATNLQFESGTLGQRYTQTANGFGDTQPVLPGSGQDQEIFAFDLPYNQTLNLDLPITIPVSAAVVLLPVNSVSIQSSQLVNSGQQSVQGQTFNVYASSSLNAGTTLSMVISGSPGASVAAGASGSLANIILGGGVFVVALAIAGFAFYRRRGKPEPIVEEDLPDAVEEDADSLIDAIAALDDLYKAGELPDAAYQLRREEMKSRLKKIISETGNPLK